MTGAPIENGGGSSMIRVDLQLIADMIEPGSRVLDVGCGDGALLAYLAQTKQTDGRGVELSMAGVSKSVRSGLSVIQGDADTDLKDYPTGAFDYVVLSQTLQAMRRPRDVVENLVRISRYAIVSFPNFAYWRVRMALMFSGKMPVTDTLTDAWYDTPNIHHCTVKDFVETCRESNIVIEQAIPLTRDGGAMRVPATGPLGNLFAEQAMFVLRRPD
ncbi:MAG: methionine biosynthesis protein MetW [Alphaproteobacteria bacterium]|jgi:methionine biosynthesis protein MetW